LGGHGASRDCFSEPHSIFPAKIESLVLGAKTPLRRGPSFLRLRTFFKAIPRGEPKRSLERAFHAGESERVFVQDKNLALSIIN